MCKTQTTLTSLRSLTGITRILLSETLHPRGLRFPVPLDKGNEGSGNEIEVIMQAAMELDRAAMVKRTVDIFMYTRTSFGWFELDKHEFFSAFHC